MFFMRLIIGTNDQGESVNVLSFLLQLSLSVNFHFFNLAIFLTVRLHVSSIFEMFHHYSNEFSNNVSKKNFGTKIEFQKQI